MLSDTVGEVFALMMKLPWISWEVHLVERGWSDMWDNHQEQETGAVEMFTGECWVQLHDNGWASGGTAMSAHWERHEGSPVSRVYFSCIQ